jgi:hypothetical protein
MNTFETITSFRPEPVDRDPSSRPGVPMLNKPSVERVMTGSLAQQAAHVPVMVGVEVGKLTPVFGSAVPPRGLSGLIRRAAYHIPEHKAGHWLLLMLGDRIDVWEGRLERHPVGAIMALGGFITVLSWGGLALRRI